MKKTNRFASAMEVTKLFETRTFHIYSEYFVDVVFDKDEDCFMYYLWREDCGHKMFTIGEPTFQHSTGETKGWEEATEEDILLYIFEEYKDLLDEEIEDLETMAEARFNARKEKQ